MSLFPYFLYNYIPQVANTLCLFSFSRNFCMIVYLLFRLIVIFSVVPTTRPHKLCTICVYLIGQNFGGQNCRKFDEVPKFLSAENFCPPKICPPNYLFSIQKSDKSAEFWGWCRIFCPRKNFVCGKFFLSNFCPIR